MALLLPCLEQQRAKDDQGDDQNDDDFANHELDTPPLSRLERRGDTPKLQLFNARSSLNVPLLRPRAASTERWHLHLGVLGRQRKYLLGWGRLVELPSDVGRISRLHA